MLVKLLQQMDPRKPLGLFGIAVVVLTAGLYVIFDFNLDSVGREIVGSWLQTEAVAIQEGNLLTSISENQRVLLSSQFVKGVLLYDTSGREPDPLIQFGEPFKPTASSSLKAGSITSRQDGFLARQVLYRVPERPYLMLAFRTHSDFLTKGFLAVVTAFLFFLLFLFASIRRVEARRIAAENKNRILLGEIAGRVAHDIRSPLNTLNAVMERAEGLTPDSRRLLTTAINRIREIATGIADQNRLALKEPTILAANPEVVNGQTELTLLFVLIEDLIEEKRSQYSNRASLIHWQPSDGSHSLFAAVNSSEFKRSLSNLIDNAVEASSPESPIVISIDGDSDEILVRISDRGRGISPAHLHRIGEKGFSKGKEKGSGLGVYYAKKAVEAFGGQLSIQSEEGKGTTVCITLRPMAAPDWHMSAISLKGAKTAIIVDDDPTVHVLWQEKLKRADPEIMIEHFFEPESVMSWVVQNRQTLGNYLLLTDYNLNSRAGDGIAVLERFGAASPNAIMVTSAFADRALQDRCAKLKVKILPKPVMNLATILTG